ncbi:EAL domain-containing protein [Vibrio aphrogenes]|uniref:EAL domain-containing protein n=1 Tax=Vibrio aphrogenes TaxID=1891186 RepID=UPI000B34CA41|nr:EAL domain-containing protein [Vibrio aphrogenes]
MSNSSLTPKAFRKVVFTFLIPLPIILMIGFYLSKLSIKKELQYIANSSIHHIEKLINELRDENKQALYDAENCQQIQKDLLFETFLREMLLVEEGKIVCSSKRLTIDSTLANILLPNHILHSGEYLYALPKPSTQRRNLFVVDQDIKAYQRSAISIIDHNYLDVALGLRDDDRLSASHLTVTGITYPEIDSRVDHSYAVTADSKDLNVNITVEPSDKLIKEKRAIYMLGGVPISFFLSIILYLINFWIKGRSSLIEDIKKALKNDEMFVVYQPLVDSQSQKIHSVETLIRWNHSRNGMIQPDIFIPLAEQHGLINDVTDFVLNKALSDWKDYIVPHSNFHVGINIPPQYLSKPNCVKNLHDIAQQFAQRNIHLCIEITERQLLNAQDREVLTDIRKLGITVAIDDFGTGYTSLSVLQDTDFDYLKIDRCFTNTIGVESINAPVLNNIIKLAHDLNTQITAEGVETPQQAEYLKNQGVELLQGFYFYNPMLIDELLEQLQYTALTDN